MRTTVEIPDHQRALLMELAARRGLKGFSVLVQEALEGYLAKLREQQDAVEKACSVVGTLPRDEADALEASIERLRERWR